MRFTGIYKPKSLNAGAFPIFYLFSSIRSCTLNFFFLNTLDHDINFHA